MDDLNLLTGAYVNLEYPLFNGESVGFKLYDRKTNDNESSYTGDYLYYEIVLGLEARGVL